MQAVPVTIFAGYLGSGKTTIILESLKRFKEPVRFAMMKNEYGDVNVDAQLARSQNIQVKEIINGCLCCVLVGELNSGIDELISTAQPERIIIESSGNALPFPIVRELAKNPKVYVDGVVVVVDCVNFEKVKDKSVVAREQAKYTDLIIFNKAGLVDEDKLYQVKEEVNELNPDTVKLETTDGVVDPYVLFGIPHRNDRWDQLLADDDAAAHRHEEGMASFIWETQGKIHLERLEEVLKACRPNSFYRIKGIVNSDAGWKLVNGVFGRVDWRDIHQPDDKKSRIVFIGNDIGQWEAGVKDYLEKTLE